MSDGPLLERLQQEVADREPIDWAGLISDLQASGEASPETLHEVSLLRLLDEIGVAHTGFQSGEFGDDGGAVARAETLSDDTLEAWGRYLLEHKVGRGGFGSVYRAWDPVLQMPVALKILHRRHSDQQLQERLLNEGRALAQVRHPNIVRVMNVEQHDGRLGLIMEFLSGETMDAVVSDSGRLDAAQASAVGEDICRALMAVHGNGLIHRDVKARNIIREPDGRVVLMDFGAGLSVTATQDRAAAVGTPLYMAPEQFDGDPATTAGDVYSVGVLLFHLVTGRHPYEGQSLEDIHDAHQTGRANRLLKLRPDLPVRFVKVVERALAIEPADRYRTPLAVQEALVAARTLALTWRQRLYTMAVFVVLVLVLMTLGGVISATAFDLTFGRGPYATESVREWFDLGQRSLKMPVVLSIVGALLVGAAVSVRNVLLPVSSTVRRLNRRLAGVCAAIAQRLSLGDATVCAYWIVIFTAVGIVGIWVTFADLLNTIGINFSTAPREAMEILSPPHLEFRTLYRMSLALVAAANITGWYALRRATAGRATKFPNWVVGLEVAVLLLIYVLMQLPYRFLNDHNKFPRTVWKSERCFILGERPVDALLFCPAATPRIRIRPASAGPLERMDAGVSMFETLAPPAAR
ncbi:MAG: serine/threonine-protein kinase [Vicinamibacteraceae bacterium]